MNDSIINVAIADDHILYLEAVAAVINNHHPYQVTIKAHNGNDLLDQLSKSISPAVILLDIGMPGMDGFETMAFLKKKTPRTKVLAISGYSNGIAISQIRRLGAHGFLSKRAGSGELIEALNKVMQTGSYYPGYEELLQQKIDEPAAIEKLYTLSTRETTFLHFACMDLSYKEIAAKMNVSRYTIDDYRDALFAKFDVQTRTALILMALKYKMVEPSGFMPGK